MYHWSYTIMVKSEICNRVTRTGWLNNTNITRQSAKKIWQGILLVDIELDELWYLPVVRG